MGSPLMTNYYPNYRAFSSATKLDAARSTAQLSIKDIFIDDNEVHLEYTADTTNININFVLTNFLTLPTTNSNGILFRVTAITLADGT